MSHSHSLLVAQNYIRLSKSGRSVDSVDVKISLEMSEMPGYPRMWISLDVKKPETGPKPRPKPGEMRSADPKRRRAPLFAQLSKVGERNVSCFWSINTCVVWQNHLQFGPENAFSMFVQVSLFHCIFLNLEQTRFWWNGIAHSALCPDKHVYIWDLFWRIFRRQTEA
jgi:hypothetical protein